VTTPTSEAELAEVLRDATAGGRRLRIRGGATKPWRAGDGDEVRTAGLGGLHAHDAGDFVCVAGAGLRLDALQEELAAHPRFRQRLMLDPPHGSGQTLGGIVAANASGPLRHRYGAPRDLLLGARFVLADGTVGASGGRVVKNVAGYDVARLLCGSLGALAVLTEVVLRLHPEPPATATVVLADAAPAAAADFCTRLRTAPVAPEAVELAWPEALVAVRIASTAAGAAAQAASAAALAPAARRLDDDEAAALWLRLGRQPWDGEGAVLGVGVPLTALADLLELTVTTGAALALRAGVGVGEARLPPPAATAFAAGVERLGGHVAVRRRAGVAALRSTPADPVAGELAAALKGRFDPAGVLGALP
jgi:glycolate oxidase FAD binding subunit